jgi:UDP-N-acetylglucosamine:LPS N-acetylglucosamine transferase
LQKISSENKFDHLFLISGPEPQRSALEDLLTEKAAQAPHLKFALARHGHKTAKNSFPSNLTAFISPDKLKLSEVISQSKMVVCRSGYSTLMDLYLLGKTEAVLVPTPGQTEQEYLAGYWEKKFGSRTVRQKDLERFLL